MKVKIREHHRVRIEMIPLIDIVFLLLVFFIYAMLSMAVHRGLPVALPTSAAAAVEKGTTLSVTVKADGAIFVDKEPVDLSALAGVLQTKAGRNRDSGVLLFADRTLPYQKLFQVLDRIRLTSLNPVSLQAEMEQTR